MQFTARSHTDELRECRLTMNCCAVHTAHWERRSKLHSLSQPNVFKIERSKWQKSTVFFGLPHPTKLHIVQSTTELVYSTTDTATSAHTFNVGTIAHIIFCSVLFFHSRHLHFMLNVELLEMRPFWSVLIKSIAYFWSSWEAKLTQFQSFGLNLVLFCYNLP